MDFTNNVLRDNKSNLSSYPLAVQSSYSLPPQWHTAATLAAWNMVMVSGGAGVSPMSIDYSGPNNKINMVSHIDGNVDFLLQQLDIPSPTSPFGFLSYDMYSNLPTGRADAIMIEVRVYKEPTLKLEWVVPYRHASHPFGFAIYPLVHKQENFTHSQEVLDALAQAFYEGAKSIKNPQTGVDFWDSYYIDSHDIFAPPIWSRQLIDHFDPTDSQIEILSI